MNASNPTPRPLAAFLALRGQPAAPIPPSATVTVPPKALADEARRLLDARRTTDPAGPSTWPEWTDERWGLTLPPATILTAGPHADAPPAA